MTPTVRPFSTKYEGTPAAVKANLARILMQGKLGGTGKVIILPVDQVSNMARAQLRGQPASL